MGTEAQCWLHATFEGASDRTSTGPGLVLIDSVSGALTVAGAPSDPHPCISTGNPYRAHPSSDGT